MILDHEVPPGSDRCKWCGAVKPGPDSTCVPRPDVGPGMMPEPARRVLACEDADSIARRIAELKTEKTAAWNAES